MLQKTTGGLLYRSSPRFTCILAVALKLVTGYVFRLKSKWSRKTFFHSWFCIRHRLSLLPFTLPCSELSSKLPPFRALFSVECSHAFAGFSFPCPPFRLTAPAKKRYLLSLPSLTYRVVSFNLGLHPDFHFPGFVRTCWLCSPAATNIGCLQYGSQLIKVKRNAHETNSGY